MLDPPVSDFRRRPWFIRSYTAVLVIFALVCAAVLYWRAHQVNRIRNDPNVRTYALVVDRNDKSCGRSRRTCGYTSYGTYFDGVETYSDVEVIGTVHKPRHGSVKVLISPREPYSAVPIGYTAAGFVGRRRRRRRRRRASIAALASGEPVELRFRGGLHGPGTPKYARLSDITITTTSLTARDVLSKATVTVDTTSIVSLYVTTPNADDPTERMVTFFTPQGSYRLACHSDDVDLVEALLRAAAPDAPLR